ncbi:hypothetical protein V5735_06850 (plasmid) [Haladaptatus sp. SPP-AMP-3]|uniref:hypothetical protein n=1 Tax=Haladaptatus sp. SPP-AMP-3 TaxID=3121295 RepID=UPI003C2E7609
MVLPASEPPASKLAYFVNVPLFVFLAVVMALYVAANLLVLHGDGMGTLGDAAQQFFIGTVGAYLGICLSNLVWDAAFR